MESLTTPRRSLAALAGLAALVLGGCSGAEPGSEARVVQPGAPGEPSRELTAEELAELEVAEPVHTQADVAFVQGMIRHHEQALEMTALVPDRSDRDDLSLFAERMEISQDDEIAQMRRWLAERGEGAVEGSGDHGAHGARMHGMATEEEMARLEAARGPAFDRLFLELMRRHHEGALQMIAELYAAGGGQEAELYQLANHMDSDQRIELSRINRLLNELDEGG